MRYSPELAAIRFGCGLSPIVPPPRSVSDLLDGLTGPDEMARTYPIEPFDRYQDRMIDLAALWKAFRKAKGDEAKGKLRDQIDATRNQARRDASVWFAHTLMRWTDTRTGLRERLAFFWADHFTARGKNGAIRYSSLPYLEQAIRPKMTGYFSDLLISVTTHPLMLQYLDQAYSVGPDSPIARKRPGRGLNENLAREVLELHTMGVDGAYTQADIRALAELFAGLSYDWAGGFRYRADFAQPGGETVLGQAYGGAQATLSPVLEFLRDLSVHPDTARHIARKMVVHFVSDQPDPDLVAHVARRYRESDGHLLTVYGALLEHPAAWQPALMNVKPPADFVASACRALHVRPDRLDLDRPGRLRRRIGQPLTRMGQPWLSPDGPDGWPEEDTAWITPQGLASRISWAMNRPRQLVDDLPDPRRFQWDALGSYAPASVRFAAQAAETRAEGVGLVLASPTFQRR
ncbi:DUF1800 domain-containing protein [Ruegeria hyattellae]|uniref:DUF1800 domain-containing protein n=1 Tax=Ruegeria hyattellae TaxID=3233337 RepID=UPI00355B79BC